MQRWEYYQGWDLSVAEMDDLGGRGWELVSVTMIPGNKRDLILYTFKRPL